MQVEHGSGAFVSRSRPAAFSARRVAALGCLVSVAGLAACTRATATGEPRSQAAPQAGSAAAEPGGPGVPWSKKTRDQRAEFMGLVVYPRMRAVFREHDPTAFAQFRCQTCHGEDMEKLDFHMPNSLYALPAADPVKAATDYDEKTARFMVEKVVPAMKELFAKDDPALAEKFGCLGCHQTEK